MRVWVSVRIFWFSGVLSFTFFLSATPAFLSYRALPLPKNNGRAWATKYQKVTSSTQKLVTRTIKCSLFPCTYNCNKRRKQKHSWAKYNLKCLRVHKIERFTNLHNLVWLSHFDINSNLQSTKYDATCLFHGYAWHRCLSRVAVFSCFEIKAQTSTLISINSCISIYKMVRKSNIYVKRWCLSLRYSWTLFICCIFGNQN